MIKEFINSWEKNKAALEEYIRTHEQNEYAEYSLLVELLFKMVINPEREDFHKYNIDDMLIIDHGDYSGAMIFVLHENDYSPYVKQYVYTNTYYGSCSGCDTLMGIYDTVNGQLPSEEQVKDYMTLCLHLLQSCSFMYDGECDDPNRGLVSFKNLKLCKED